MSFLEQISTVTALVMATLSLEPAAWRIAGLRIWHQRVLSGNQQTPGKPKGTHSYSKNSSLSVTFTLLKQGTPCFPEKVNMRRSSALRWLTDVHPEQLCVHWETPIGTLGCKLWSFLRGNKRGPVSCAITLFWQDTLESRKHWLEFKAKILDQLPP